MKQLKKMITIIVIAISISAAVNAQVGINVDSSAPDASAILDLKSTSKGFLPPRMTEAERDAISSPAVGLVVWCNNCGDAGELQVYNGSIWTNAVGDTASPYVPEIGDFAFGGVIFYIDGNGGGLVCAVSDQDYQGDYLLEWGCDGTQISGADGTIIGTGAQNTIDIEAGCTTPGTAADACANSTLNGYSDWFLPSKDELNEMYQNKTVIDAIATANGGTAFGGVNYWSSSEVSSGSAWGQYFSNGLQGLNNKGGHYNVRAIRAF